MLSRLVQEVGGSSVDAVAASQSADVGLRRCYFGNIPRQRCRRGKTSTGVRGKPLYSAAISTANVRARFPGAIMQSLGEDTIVDAYNRIVQTAPGIRPDPAVLSTLPGSPTKQAALYRHATVFRAKFLHVTPVFSAAAREVRRRHGRVEATLCATCCSLRYAACP